MAWRTSSQSCSLGRGRGYYDVRLRAVLRACTGRGLTAMQARAGRLTASAGRAGPLPDAVSQALEPRGHWQPGSDAAAVTTTCDSGRYVARCGAEALVRRKDYVGGQRQRSI